MSQGTIVVCEDPEERELYAFALRQAVLAVQPHSCQKERARRQSGAPVVRVRFNF